MLLIALICKPINSQYHKTALSALLLRDHKGIRWAFPPNDAEAVCLASQNQVCVVVYLLSITGRTYIYLSAYFKDFVEAEFQRPDNPVRQKEEQAWIYFLDFIDDCEGKARTWLSSLSSGLH